MTRTLVFVRAAAYTGTEWSDTRTHVTGRVLHLAVWVPDAPGVALMPGTGRWSPVCAGSGRQVDVWEATGPDFTGWKGHAHWPVCSRCTAELARLIDTVNDQDDRHDRHQQAAR